MTDTREEYLGDGVYASYDGYTIKLRAPRPAVSRMFGDHEIYLEPAEGIHLARFMLKHWGAKWLEQVKPKAIIG